METETIDTNTQAAAAKPVKKQIPHVNHAGGNNDKHRAALGLVDEQVQAGHYTLEWEQHHMGPGWERVIIDRREVDPSHPGEPHSL